MTIEHPCPECQSPPTAESLAESNLTDLGYLHDDKRLECSACDNSWQIGIPRGEVASEAWVCDACNGNFMPHFVYVYTEKNEVRVRPKCQSCYWVPDDPLVFDSSQSGDTYRWFVEHHETTGNRDDATVNSL